MEGILRISGSQDDVDRFKEVIKRRTFSFNDMKGVDPHTISKTLKDMLRSLPVKLVPSKINERISVLVSKRVPSYKLVYEIKKSLSFLPQANFDVFKLLCKLMLSIINNSPTNHMDLKNVLSCFVESVQCSPSFFSTALKNYDYFFCY